jgi:hypothetical protein
MSELPAPVITVSGLGPASRLSIRSMIHGESRGTPDTTTAPIP